MFFHYLSTPTPCSLVYSSSTILANAFDLWLYAIIGFGNLDFFTFTDFLVQIILFCGHVFHANGGFSYLLWTKFTGKPACHGTVNCAVHFLQIGLKVYSIEITQALVILHVAFECMFFSAAPFLVCWNCWFLSPLLSRRLANFMATSQLIRMYLTCIVFDIVVYRLLVTFHCVSCLGGVSLKQNLSWKLNCELGIFQLNTFSEKKHMARFLNVR